VCQGIRALTAGHDALAGDASDVDPVDFTQCSRPACGVWMHTPHTDAANVPEDADWDCPACVVKVCSSAVCDAGC
jgi:hypothetical protein